MPFIPSLLSLPRDIRAQIFRESGLVRKCLIGFSQEKIRLWRMNKGFFGIRRNISCHDFNNNADKKIHINANDDSDDSLHDIDGDSFEDTIPFSLRLSKFDYFERPLCVHDSLPIELLVVCNQIYHEAIEILYGENEFYLDCCDQRAVYCVVNLNHWALASLRTIHVFFGQHCVTTYGRLWGTAPLLRDQADFQTGQEQWAYLCRTLSQAMPPFRVSLSFSCNVADVATAQSILDPLKYLPLLRQIRLDVGDAFCCSPLKRQIKIILRSAATESTIPVSQLPKASFPFSSLPYELRLMVLSYSGLIVDVRINKSSVGERIYGIHLDNRKSPCLWRVCCGTCDRILGCCRCNWCGTYSSSCSCVPVPTALFLTSKRMRAEALQVFYGSNQFAVEGTIQDVLLHLSRVPTGRLRFLKRLCIDAKWPPRYDQCWHWERVFDLFQNQCESSRLIIKIVFGSTYVRQDGSLWKSCQLSLRWLNNLRRKFGFRHLLILVPKMNSDSLHAVCFCNESCHATTLSEYDSCTIASSEPVEILCHPSNPNFERRESFWMM